MFIDVGEFKFGFHYLFSERNRLTSKFILYSDRNQNLIKKALLNNKNNLVIDYCREYDKQIFLHKINFKTSEIVTTNKLPMYTRLAIFIMNDKNEELYDVSDFGFVICNKSVEIHYNYFCDEGIKRYVNIGRFEEQFSKKQYDLNAAKILFASDCNFSFMLDDLNKIIKLDCDSDSGVCTAISINGNKFIMTLNSRNYCTKEFDIDLIKTFANSLNKLFFINNLY